MEQNEMSVVSINLNVNELNLILAALGKQPFEIVNGLINKIVTDAQAQLPNASAEQAEAA